MKKIMTFLVVLIALVTTTYAQNTAESTVAPQILQLKEVNYDFGKIQQGRPVTHIFEIKNTGTEPLRLDNVQASCGCTTPEWNHDAIAAGASSTIKVGYNAAAEGSFSKTVTIQYNGNQTKTLVITGTVFKAPTTSAPANASLALLKQINQ